MTTAQLPTSEILNLAADLIEKRGWRQARGLAGEDPWGNGAGSSEPICLEGGILAAMGIALPIYEPLVFSQEREDLLEELEACPAYESVTDYLGTCRPYHFNDAEGRTQAEVIEVLRATALIESARETELAKASA